MGSAVAKPKLETRKRHRWKPLDVSNDSQPFACGTFRGTTSIEQAGRRWTAKRPAENCTRQICGIESDGLTSLSAIKFHVADVSKPLAAAAKVAKAGNIIVMHPDEDKCFIQNIGTGERMQLREKRGAYVFDVVFEDTKEKGEVTLDSGAGVSVWPKGKMKEVKLLPKQKGLRMKAANGTEIVNEGQKVIRFRGRSGEARDC